MLEKHILVMLNYIPYGDTSMIVRSYSNTRGPISLIINGVRKKKPKIHQAQLQPMQIQQAEVVFNPKKTLHKVKELHALEPLENLVFNILKSTQCQLLGEVLYKSLKDEVPNQNLFEFIKSAIIQLNQSKRPNNFHIQFLVELSRQLGFHPHITKGRFLDLISGTTLEIEPMHEHYIDLVKEPFWTQIWEQKLWEEDFNIDTNQRQKILKNLMKYYAFHLEGFGTLASLNVLTEIFH